MPPIWLKSAWKRGLRDCGNAVGNYIGTRKKLVEPDLLLKSYEKISVSLRLAMNPTLQKEFESDSERAPKGRCTAVVNNGDSGKPMTSQRLR